ncbi:TIGR03016 family PEP-CTERM system-associated outer membrane protein [Geobacter sp.]|uniref:TIGR03016 family PEP-CTERM system-associated outer membrane protein n=1 Tax=Geobacter sp. TaxID=46610 RepID=UPI001ACAF20B|nr:TIGR03016 family PEP-CTERM system-associated outer membrane protein [Geobacter sp.]CAG0975766.1 hypothetical protein ANAEL_01437 [Anaerolineales bacterium]
MRACIHAATTSLLLVCAWASHAAAEFNLTPSLLIREEYNDNIDLERDDRVDDFITIINPSLGISWKTSFVELSADYGLGFRFYLKNSDRNETDITGAQRAKVDSTFTLLPERLFLKVSDVFERVPIDERDQVAYENYLVNMTNTNRFTVNPYLQYPITATLFLNAGYTYNNIWYDDPAGDNSQSHIATVGLTQYFGERLSIFGSYSYRWYRPEGDQTDSETGSFDYDSQTGTVGALMQLTSKLSLNGSVGYTSIKYKPVKELFIPVIFVPGVGLVQVGPPFESNIAPSDSSSAIWDIKTTYRLSDRLSLSGGYSQSFQDSVSEGAVKNRSAIGAISYDAKIPITLSVFHTRGKYVEEDREDKATGGTLSLGIPLTGAITLRVDGTYSYRTFEPDGEKINRYGFRTGFDYQIIPKATVGVGYTFNREDSNVDENDYYNNIAFVQARYTF